MNVQRENSQEVPELSGYHRKVSTLPAIRAIGALSRGEHAQFLALSENPNAQEEFLIARWLQEGDVEARAAHNAARSLQAVEAMLQGDSDELVVNRYFLLVHGRDHESRYHWLHESYFRSGVRMMMRKYFDDPTIDTPELTDISCNMPAEAYKDTQLDIESTGVGRLVIESTFDRYRAPEKEDDPKYFDLDYAGKPFASRYRFELSRLNLAD